VPFRNDGVYDETVLFSSPAIVSAQSTLSSTPAFDPTQLLLLMQDGQEQTAIVFGLLDTVLSSGTASLDAARQSWQEGKADHATRQLHTVRGTLGTSGLRRFAAASLAAEQALRSQPMGTDTEEDAIESLFDTAAQALQDGLADMRTWLAAQRLSMP
jgi:two-component system, sensor histidine kinase and response regulator